jgi:hypothetical protein
LRRSSRQRLQHRPEAEVPDRYDNEPDAQRRPHMGAQPEMGAVVSAAAACTPSRPPPAGGGMTRVLDHTRAQRPRPIVAARPTSPSRDESNQASPDRTQPAALKTPRKGRISAGRCGGPGCMSSSRRGEVTAARDSHKFTDSAPHGPQSMLTLAGSGYSRTPLAIQYSSDLYFSPTPPKGDATDDRRCLTRKRKKSESCY